MSITRMDVPAISTQGLMKLLQLMMPRRLERDSNMYDVGYETAKRDFAAVIGKELGVELSENPAGDLLKQMRRASSI